MRFELQITQMPKVNHKNIPTYNKIKQVKRKVQFVILRKNNSIKKKQEHPQNHFFKKRKT